MPLDFTELEAVVAENESVDAGAIALLDILFAEFEANKNAPAAIQAIVDKGRAANARLAAAIVAKTPAAEEPTEPVDPEVPAEPTEPTEPTEGSPATARKR